MAAAAVGATATEAAPEPEPLWSRTKNLRLANAKRTQQFPITSVAATQFSIYLYFTTAALRGVKKIKNKKKNTYRVR